MFQATAPYVLSSLGVVGGGCGNGAESTEDGWRRARAAQIVDSVFTAAPDEMRKLFCRFCDMTGRTGEIQSSIVTIL